MSVSGGGDSEACPEERKQSVGTLSPSEGDQDAAGQARPELLPPPRLRTPLPLERARSVSQALTGSHPNR